MLMLKFVPWERVCAALDSLFMINSDLSSNCLSFMTKKKYNIVDTGLFNCCSYSKSYTHLCGFTGTWTGYQDTWGTFSFLCLKISKLWIFHVVGSVVYKAKVSILIFLYLLCRLKFWWGRLMVVIKWMSLPCLLPICSCL